MSEANAGCRTQPRNLRFRERCCAASEAARGDLHGSLQKRPLDISIRLYASALVMCVAPVAGSEDPRLVSRVSQSCECFRSRVAELAGHSTSCAKEKLFQSRSRRA